MPGLSMPLTRNFRRPSTRQVVVGSVLVALGPRPCAPRSSQRSPKLALVTNGLPATFRSLSSTAPLGGSPPFARASPKRCRQPLGLRSRQVKLHLHVCLTWFPVVVVGCSAASARSSLVSTCLFTTLAGVKRCYTVRVYRLRGFGLSSLQATVLVSCSATRWLITLAAAAG